MSLNLATGPALAPLSKTLDPSVPLSSGYLPCRADYLGTQGEAFDRKKAKPRATFRLGVPGLGEGEQVFVPRALETPPYDQKRLGSCEAQAGRGALFIMTGYDCSALDLYLKALYRNDTWPNDNGTDGETIQHVLTEEGVCRATSRSYTDDATWTKPTPLDALEEGYDHCFNASHRITSDEPHVDVMAAIDAGRVVQIGGLVSGSYMQFFMDRNAARCFTAADLASGGGGGHAQVIVGYWRRVDGTVWFLVRNSWGGGGLASIPGHAWYSADAVDAADELFAYYVDNGNGERVQRDHVRPRLAPLALVAFRHRRRRRRHQGEIPARGVRARSARRDRNGSVGRDSRSRELPLTTEARRR